MTVRHKSETLLNEDFFENAFKHEMNGDVTDTVFEAFCAMVNEYDEATRLERIGCMAKLLIQHDAAEDWLAVAAEVRRLREPAEGPTTEAMQSEADVDCDNRAGASHRGLTIEERDNSQSAKDRIYYMIDQWCREHDLFSGESIIQSDAASLELPDLLAEIVDEIIKYQITWED